jgi:hypothetical protein
MLLALGASADEALAQSVRLTHYLRPEGAIRRGPTQLVLTVDAARAPTGGALTVIVPAGFTVRELRASGVDSARSSGPASTTARVDLGVFVARTSKAFEIEPNADRLQRGKYRVIASVHGDSILTSGSSGTEVILATDEFDVDYAPSISIPKYLVIGLLGVFIGWVIRLLVKVRDSIQPPPLAPVPGATTPGPVTRFVTRYYYWVDAGVTLAIALFVLVFLIKDGFPPEGASQWYSALGTGAGLGFLTNSELITKLPR